MKKHSTRNFLAWLKKGLRLIFYVFAVIGLMPLVLLVAFMTYGEDEQF